MKKSFLPATSGMKTQWLLLGSNTMGCVQKHMYEPSVFKHCPPTHRVSSRHSLMSTKKPKSKQTFNGIIIKSCQLLFLTIDQCIHTYKINYLAINNSLAKNPVLPTNSTPFHFILLKIALIHYLI